MRFSNSSAVIVADGPNPRRRGYGPVLHRRGYADGTSVDWTAENALVVRATDRVDATRRAGTWTVTDHCGAPTTD